MNRQKSAFGICYWFYTVAAFLLAVLGQTLLCGVLLCFVIATEKAVYSGVSPGAGRAGDSCGERRGDKCGQRRLRL